MMLVDERTMVAFLGDTFLSFYKQHVAEKNENDLSRTFTTNFLIIVKKTYDDLNKSLSSESPIEEPMKDLITNLAKCIQTFRSAADIMDQELEKTVEVLFYYIFRSKHL